MVYKQIIVLFRNNPNSEDEFDGGTHSVTFNNAVLVISGDHIIITENVGDGEVEGKIYKLNTVHSYKATNN